MKSSIWVRFNYEKYDMTVEYDNVKIILKRGETHTYEMISRLIHHPSYEFRKFNPDCVTFNSTWLILSLIIKDYHQTGGIHESNNST